MRMKEIIETTWLRDPSLNDKTAVEFKNLKKQIEDMGLYVTWETQMDLKDPTNPKLNAEIKTWIPKVTTIQ
jgi:hypothetical protein